MIEETVAAVGSRAELPMPTKSGARHRPKGTEWDDVAPEIGRRRIAVQEDDGVAVTHIHIGHIRSSTGTRLR